MSYIEIKACQTITSTLAQKLVDKGTVSAVLTTGKITGPAKALFDQNNIAWAELIPEKEFMESEAQEVD